MYRNFSVLFLAQLFTFASAPVVIYSGGLIGMSLYGDMSLATLPVAFFMVGTALSTYPASQIMQRLGRKKGFILGNVLACGGIVLILWSLSIASFVVYCIATVLLGSNMAFMQQYRFAVVEGVLVSRLQNQFIAWLSLSGLVGTFGNLQLVSITRHWFEVDFLGTYVLLGVGLLVAQCFLWFFKDASVSTTTSATASKSQANDGVVVSTSNYESTIGRLFANPLFIFGAFSAATAYVVMAFIMTATPLYLKIHLGYSDLLSSLVIQLHIAAMLLPSLITGHLINRFGNVNLIVAGIFLLILAQIVNVYDETFENVLAGLILLGVGWNFMFISATSYIAKNFTGEGRFKVQGLSEMFTFGGQASVALFSGWCLSLLGWEMLNWLFFPLLIIMLMMSHLKTIRNGVLR